MSSAIENKYIYAYDPMIKRRVPFVVDGNKAISLVTGFSFAYDPTISIKEEIVIINKTINDLKKMKLTKENRIKELEKEGVEQK